MDGRNPGEQVEAQFKEQGASRYRHAGIKLKKSPGGFREIHSRPSFPVNGDKFKKGFVNKQPPAPCRKQGKFATPVTVARFYQTPTPPLKISTQAT